MMIFEIILSLRPKQWVKNLLIFAPLFFSGQVFTELLLIISLQGFFIFSLVVSGGYLINDVFDKSIDAKHPFKNKRPIAKGSLKTSTAILIAILMNFIGLIWAYNLNLPFFFISLIYLMIMLGYHTWLKNYVLLDIIIVSSGYLLRIIGGGLLIKVEPSPWLLLVTFSLSLFLVVSKRIGEMKNIPPENRRKSLNFYSENMLNNMLVVSTTLTITAYAIYAFLSTNNPVINRNILQLSLLPVIFGIFRYLYLMDKNNGGEEPEEELFRDSPLLTSVLIWIIIMFGAYYIKF
ncbi:MAG: Decaprenyl-phosphate phosphoribosyltransferase [candidate division WS2 bacterium]|nr:Decaprenyl-phosphate phosphoribosyltransferase [Candidatus Psychracetigena formicireducens]